MNPLMSILESISITEKVTSFVRGVKFQTGQGPAFPLNQLVDDMLIETCGQAPAGLRRKNSNALENYRFMHWCPVCEAMNNVRHWLLRGQEQCSDLCPSTSPKHRRHDTSNHRILAFFRKVMAGVISPCMHSTHDRKIQGTTH